MRCLLVATGRLESPWGVIEPGDELRVTAHTQNGGIRVVPTDEFHPVNRSGAVNPAVYLSPEDFKTRTRRKEA